MTNGNRSNRWDHHIADRGTPPAAIGRSVTLRFCQRDDPTCADPITLHAVVVADPDHGRVWWTRFPDTGQVAVHDIGDHTIDAALHEFRMAIARYRRWRPEPRRGHYDRDTPAEEPTAQIPHLKMLQAIDEFWRTFGEAPSNNDLLRMTNYRSTASIVYHLTRLERVGYIEREYGRHRSTKITEAGRRVLARHLHPTEQPHEHPALPVGHQKTGHRGALPGAAQPVQRSDGDSVR